MIDEREQPSAMHLTTKFALTTTIAARTETLIDPIKQRKHLHLATRSE
jgi:hypothetical protein